MAKFLVTGGAGFIGSNICDELLRQGNEVVALDNFDPFYAREIKERNVKNAGKNKNFKLVEKDICDLETVKTIIKEESIEYIIHEAAQAGVRISVQDPLKPNRVNAQGTLNILLASLDSSVKKIINASSSSVYGKVKYLPFDEEHPKNPISPYGVSKLIAEHYCRVFYELYGLRYTTLRYFTVYGPRVRPDLAIATFLGKALRNEPLEIFGDGKKSRDFTFVKDAVDATLLAVDKGDCDVFNIGGGNRITVNELAHKILELTKSKSKIVYTQDQKGDVQETLANNKKAREVLGWKPKHKIEDGLEVYLSWLKQ